MKWYVIYIVALFLVLISACVHIINQAIGPGSAVIVFFVITLLCTVLFVAGCAIGVIFSDRL